MLLRSIVLMITGILGFVPASYAANVDSLLAKYIAIPKPYIIIYIPANNCDFHRGAECQRALLELKSAIPSNKMTLLTDDDMMRTHFKNNTEVYEGFNICYNKELSYALPYRTIAGSKLCIVTDTGITYYKLPGGIWESINTIPVDYDTTAENETYNTIQQVDYTVKEDMFADRYMNFEFNKKTSVFQEDRFQTGLIKSGKKTSITESALDDSSMAFLYLMLSQYVADSFRTVHHSKGLLKVFMTPLVDIKNIRIAGNEAYVLFNVNTVSENTTISPDKEENSNTDTSFIPRLSGGDMDNAKVQREEHIRAKSFIAKVDLNKKDNPFNLSLSNSEGYSWLNYRELEGESHYPVEGINIEAVHDTIFVPLRTYTSGSKSTDKENISVGAYTFNSMNKMVITKTYRTSIYDNHINQHLIRAKNGHEPFMIDRVRKSVTTLADNREIHLDNYVSEIFDAQIRDNGIVFAGLNNKKQTTVSFFDFKSNTVTSSRVIDASAAVNATIAANTLQWYRKDNNQKLKLNSYTIKDFGNTTPFNTSLRINKN